MSESEPAPLTAEKIEADVKKCGQSLGIFRVTSVHVDDYLRALRQLQAQAAELARLREAIREHHSQKADDRCWEDDDRLYAAAGLPPCDCRVGSKEEMLANCRRFIERRCEGGGWPTYKALEAERDAAMKHAGRMVCFGCGKPWSVEADAETCDQAHRETWGHEWVTPRVNDLTARLFKANEQRDASRAIVARLAEAMEEAASAAGKDWLEQQLKLATALDEARAAGGVLRKEGGA